MANATATWTSSQTDRAQDIPVTAGMTTRDLVLGEGLANWIEGRVIGKDGQPVAGAVVNLYHDTAYPITETDAAGEVTDGIDLVLDDRISYLPLIAR